MAKVLVVEDNYYTRVVLTRKFVRSGFQVLTAIDGVEALRLAHAEHPDLILLDIRLPMMDGWEVARQLKAEPDTCAIPIIAMSAYDIDSSREKALQFGCADYEAKPVDFTQLLGKIHALLGQQPAPASPDA
jgi:two-component system cell cycle response regulator DivK